MVDLQEVPSTEEDMNAVRSPGVSRSYSHLRMQNAMKITKLGSEMAQPIVPSIRPLTLLKHRDGQNSDHPAGGTVESEP